MADPAPPQPASAPPQPEPQPPTAAGPQAGTTDTGVPAAAFGLLPDGAGFVAKLGPGFRLGAEFLSGERVPLEGIPQPIPGVRFATAQYRNRELRLRGDLTIPHVAEGGFEVRVNRSGVARVHGQARRRFDLPALGNPQITLAMAEETGQITGEVAVEGADLLPQSLRRRTTATGSGTLRIAAGKLSGNGTIEITYTNLGNGTVNFRFTEAGAFSANGSIRVTPPFADEITADLGVDEAGNITASTTISVSAISSPIPALSLTGGSVTLGYQNGQPSGTFENVTASYQGLGTVTVEQASISRAAVFTGNGTFAFEIPGLNETGGSFRITDGAVSGTIRLGADAFPEGLPVRNPRITATLSEAGRVGVTGSATVDLGPAGTGNFSATYSEVGELSFGADVTLTIPGLNEVTAHVGYANGAISGEVQVPVNTELLPGLDGTITVRYEQDRWSGETTLNYSADDGNLSGSITVTVAQTDAGALELGGSGSVTAQLMPRLQGTLEATILPEGGVDISGAIEVTEPLELFPEKRTEKELFRYSQNIPLWAILVAVIRVRAGVRAGVGPGVFRHIRVEGSYTIGADEADPSFTVSGELYIPAFVEGYVAFGAGLGVDVVLGSLTGGIEAVGTAGLYGAISVVPELSYADGDWGIEGTATLAAGARLKLGLNAWAEIEALWVTVWSEEWELAQHTMPIGPDLALQAKMSYKFGRPEPPEIEFNASDIDTEALIQGAMPKDGPPASGAREALQNRAEWQGALREQRQEPVPPELAAEANAQETPPQPAQQPSAAPGAPPAGDAAAQASGQQPDPAAPGPAQNPQAESQAANEAAQTDSSVQGAVPESELPNTDQPRYPSPISLGMLEQAPAPMPRTPAQEQEDVDAAKRMVELASAQATDSDRLDNYFPAIKRRFRLAALGYEGDFQRGFRVVGKINPEFSFEPDEKLSGTGIPDEVQQGRITQITFKSQKLGGDDVGVEMEASPLGPDHPQGSGPSGQNTLMSLLPTNPRIYSASDSRYIRGHLLNDNLGGPGSPVNLFPITAQANARHHSSIESHVKSWVNDADKRYWVKYVVKVQNIGALKAAVDNKRSVDAVIRAEASVLDTELNPVSALTRRVTIASTYNAGDVDTVNEEQTEQESAFDSVETRAIDQAVEVQLSSRHRSSVQTFDDGMRATITQKIGVYGSLNAVADKLKEFRGFGDRSAQVLKKAYGQAVRAGGSNPTLTLEEGEKGVFTRIANNWDQGLRDIL